MIVQLLEIFFNVIAPVFALVAIGYLLTGRLQLQAQTLSRVAYYVLIPAFIFNVMSSASVESGLALRMVGFITVVELACGAIAFLLARLLRRSRSTTAAYVLIAVFGNVGNFGLPIIEFRLGSEALVAATLYFLAISIIGFVLGVGAASWSKGSGPGAVLSVVKTPALLALIPAVAVNGLNWEVPLLVSRVTSLLAAAMVPIMLVTLGVQLAQTKRIRLSGDVLLASGVRLIVGPLLAIALAAPFAVGGIERGAGIFQAGMPAAVLTAIIALEYDAEPEFVTTAVLFSTLASVITLTLLLAVV